MKDQINQAVSIALQGSRKVKITFKQDAIDSIPYLLGMVRSGLVMFEHSIGEVNMQVALQTHDWDHDLNRTTTLRLLDKFDLDWFSNRLDRALEKIEATN